MDLRMGYSEFDVDDREPRLTIAEKKLMVVFPVFSALLAVPMCLKLQLGMDGSAWYWANTGNIFTDWSVWYLNIIPLWVIVSSLWMGGKLQPYKLAKWVVVFYLGYWLFYDFCWWAIVGAMKPESFAWDKPFYFAIIVPDPPMWFFLLISIIGACLSVLLLYLHDSWLNLIPFVIWIGYVYGIGGIAEVAVVEPWMYLAWSIVFASGLGSYIIVRVLHVMVRRR